MGIWWISSGQRRRSDPDTGQEEIANLGAMVECCRERLQEEIDYSRDPSDRVGRLGVPRDLVRHDSMVAILTGLLFFLSA
jgi:hypothetical protein